MLCHFRIYSATDQQGKATRDTNPALIGRTAKDEARGREMSSAE